MANKKITMLSWLIGGVIVLAAAGFTLKSLSASSGERIYSAKFVCGTMSSKMSNYPFPPFGGAVSPGKFTSSINIHNISKEKIKIEKIALLAPREPSYGSASSSVIMELPAMTATAADCQDIYSILGYASSTTAYVEGFLDVRAKSDVSVTAVYTGQSLKADGTPLELSTMNVEQILPHLVGP